MRSISGLAVRFSAAMALLAGASSTADAAASVPYTVTDLGRSSWDVAVGLSKDAAGSGTVQSTDGKTAYAFQRSDNFVTNSQSVLQEFPPLTNAPIYSTLTYGNPKNAYSYLDTSNVFLNRNGFLVATDLSGVYGHIASAGSSVMAAHRQADGTFGPLMSLWGAPENRDSGGQIAQAVGLNDQNQVVGLTSHGGGFHGDHASVLYDLNTGKYTDIQSFVPDWSVQGPIALDEMGRILIRAHSLAPDTFPWTTDYSDHLLLLTPAGLLSNPIPTPEPTTLAILAVAGTGLAVRRRLGR